MTNHLSDLRGASRLAVDATAGITSLVEALHTTIAATPLRASGPLTRKGIADITSLVYRGIHGVTRVVGGSLDVALRALTPSIREVPSTAEREALVAALNGVLGDYLVESDNPLALSMSLRRDGQPLALTREALSAAIPSPSGRVLVLVHGLCMNDRQWSRQGHDHGARLAADLGYSPVYLLYNSGLHVSTNGWQLAVLLDALVSAWPVPMSAITLIGHSMGGLVARSARHQAVLAGHAWPRLQRAQVFLGTPHHGAPLERGGHWIDLLLEATPYTAPFARLGRIRSAGITDLRHGSVLEQDWAGHGRFAGHADRRQPVPLPEGVGSFAVAGTTGARDAGLHARFIGDGLVPLPSALGQHRDPRFALAFPDVHQWIARDTNHLDLLSRPLVYERLKSWLAE